MVDRFVHAMLLSRPMSFQRHWVRLKRNSVVEST
jgi:hypothetical protein